MAQRTNERAFYDVGRWARRDGRDTDYDKPGEDRSRGRKRRKGTDHLPRPRWHGWTAENWKNAHFVRWRQNHGHQCPCLSAESMLWRDLQAAYAHLTGKGRRRTA